MSKEIIEILDYLGSKMGLAIDWTSENVLPYVEQLCNKFISWQIATSIAWIVIGVIIFLIGLLFIKFVKYCSEEIDEFLGFILLIVTLFLLISPVIIIPTQAFDIIECKTFPEKVIYDYVIENTDILD